MKCQIPIFFLSLLLLLACTPKQETLTIGGLFALTDYGSSWGVPAYHAAQMAVDEANAKGGIDDKQIKLIAEDTRTDPTTAISGFQKLTDINQVQVIIGPTWDQSASAIAPLADKAQVLVVAADATGSVEDKEDFPYFFSLWYPETPRVQVLQDFAKKRGMTRFVVVYNLNIFSQYIKDKFVEESSKSGVKIVAEFPITGDEERDFRSILLKMKGLDIDAVFTVFTVDENMIPFLNQANEFGLNKTVFSGAETETEELAKAYSASPTHVFKGAVGREDASFKTAYKAKYTEEPREGTANAYDATKLVIAAFKSGARTGPEIRRFLMNVKNFPSAAFGTLNFDEKGAVKTEEPGVFVVKTAKDGKFVEVKE